VVDCLVTRLFEPLALRGTTFANRIWLAPMCQYSAVEGVPNDWHLMHLGSHALGGYGLVLTEATAVVPEGRISPQDTGLWNDLQQHSWARIVDFVHDLGTPIGIQLSHAGRKSATFKPWAADHGTVPVGQGGWQPTAPSAIPYPGYATPTQMSVEQITDVVQAFGAAAVRAGSAGFDVIEIHAAHGYLLHQFLSPLSNQRTDDYGVTLAGRARLLLEVVDEVRAH
jgi:2,4-dienoyl-CoA reductase-like NADH-dependent reductase (Old Yellow Enzyme family)